MDFEPRLIKKEDRPFNSLDGPGLSWFLIVAAMALLASSVLFFSKSGGDYPPPITASIETAPVETYQPRIYTISHKSGVFSPTNLRIHSGDTVRFKNDGLLAIRVVSDPHPEHNNLVGFDSVGDIPAGSFFTFTFAAKGVFSYHNEKDVNQAGTIIVR